MNSRIRKNQHGWSVKIRSEQGDHWFAVGLDHDAGEAAAEDRRKRMQRIANLLKAAGRGGQSREFLVEAAAERSERDFRKIEVAIEGFSPDAAEGPRTFREVAEYYSSGRFQDDYPDSVKKRKGEGSLALSKKRLEAFYPEIGALTFPRITDALVDKAKRKIPKVDVNTRRAYLQELRRVLRIAVRPLRLWPVAIDIEIPPKGPRKQFTFLYPAEEYQLISSGRPPFRRRFLYAWLARNGERIEEALQITWGHVDLDNGKVRVEADWTKTGIARFWDLDEDVLEALSLLHASLDPRPTERVFLSPTGRPMNRRSVLRWMQKDLRAAGLTRPELLEAGAGEQALRVHDLGRGTFVTLARALGRPDRWIMDRTGHDSVQSLELYDRVTRHARERNLGWLAPMGRALGMAGAVSLGPSWAQGWIYGIGQALAKTQKVPIKTPDGSVLRERQRPSITEENRQKTVTGESPETPVGHRGQPGGGVVGQSSGQSPPGEDTPPDPVETALAFAIAEATKDKRYDVVLVCSRELEQRRLARQGSNVTSIDSRRKPRNGDKP